MASPLITCITYSSHCQAKALLTDDYGKDLASVEALIRRHDELERDLTAIENKLEVSVCKCMCVCVFVYVCLCVLEERDNITQALSRLNCTIILPPTFLHKAPGP